MKVTSLAKRITFLIGAAELVLGVIFLLASAWIFLVTGTLGEPRAWAILALIAGGLTVIFLVTQRSVDSDSPKAVSVGLGALIMLPIIAYMAAR